MELQISNRSLAFIEQMQQSKDQIESVARFAKSSTIFNIQNYENADNSHPLNLRFYLPPNVAYVNDFIVKFNIEDFRSMTSVGGTTGSGSSHSHTVNSHTHGDGSYSVSVSGTTGSAGQHYHFWAIENGTATGWGPRAMLDGGGSGSTRQFDLNSQILSGGHTTDLESNHDHSFSDSSSVSGTSGSASPGTSSESSHTHSVSSSKGITDTSQASPSLTLKFGIDGAESNVGTYTTSSSVNLTEELSDVVDFDTGNWFNILLVPAGGQKMRLEVNGFMRISL